MSDELRAMSGGVGSADEYILIGEADTTSGLSARGSGLCFFISRR